MLLALVHRVSVSFLPSLIQTCLQDFGCQYTGAVLWCVCLSHSVMSRLAVVCGGSRGIGKAVCRLLAERGCRLAVVSRNEDAARATVASLRGGIGHVVTLLCWFYWCHFVSPTLPGYEYHSVTTPELTSCTWLLQITCRCAIKQMRWYLLLQRTDCGLVGIITLTVLSYLLSSRPCGSQLRCLQRAGGAENLWDDPEDLRKHLLSCECSWHQQVSRHSSSSAVFIVITSGHLFQRKCCQRAVNFMSDVVNVCVCLCVCSGTLCCWGPSRTTWWLCFTPTCWAPCWPAGQLCAACCTPRGLPSLT